MAILPMQLHPGYANAWQGVFAPGGYEWWRFDARESANDRRIIVTFFDGDPFDPAYQRAYARYRRNPTRVTPPFPRDCRGVRVAIHRGGHIEHQTTVRSPTTTWIATDDPTRITLGPGCMEIQPSGAINLRLDPADTLPAVHLTFHPPHPFPAPSPAEIARHQWIASPHRYVITGNIGEHAFDGTGVWEHVWGMLPLGHELRRWMPATDGGQAIDMRRV